MVGLGLEGLVEGEDGERLGELCGDGELWDEEVIDEEIVGVCFVWRFEVKVDGHSVEVAVAVECLGEEEEEVRDD